MIIYLDSFKTAKFKYLSFAVFIERPSAIYAFAAEMQRHLSDFMLKVYN